MGLNRQQLRQQVKQGKLYTEAQLMALLRKSHDYTMKEFTHRYTAVITLALRDQLGFGPKRAHAFMEHVEQILLSLADSTITIEDIYQTIEDEVGVVIK